MIGTFHNTGISILFVAMVLLCINAFYMSGGTSMDIDDDDYYRETTFVDEKVINHSGNTDTTNPMDIMETSSSIEEERRERTGKKDVANSTTFTRYDRVVIVSKVFGPQSSRELKQMLCCVSHAYNDRVQYDIIVFTTMRWSEQEIADVRQVVSAPVKLKIVLEGPPLEDQLKAMSKENLKFLRDRCGLKDAPNETLTWFHYCREENYKSNSNLAYSWQAEFRAYNIWKHHELKDYKYMIWFDSDIRIGMKWQEDPMKMMIENDLTLLYAGFPYGYTKNEVVKKKIKNIYNKTFCTIRQLKSGHLYPHSCDSNPNFNLPSIAGNHHITNLNVYREDIHQRFLKDFVGDYRFGRQFDDQIATTIPAIVDGGKRAWHQRTNGLSLKIAHHGMYDCEINEKAPRNKKVFFDRAKSEWPSLGDRCSPYF